MITVAAAQYPITEHANFKAWALHVERWVVDAVSQSADLLLFPEYGSMELVSIFMPEIRQDLRRQVLEMDTLREDFCAVFSSLATRYGVILVAPSFPVVLKNKTVNRTFVFSPDGLAGYQDKLFMTRFEDEEWGIESGEKVILVFETYWGAFGIQTCYDIEFPLGSKLLGSAGASLVLVPSCTETLRGATRVHVGARARALENQLYTVVAQTVNQAEWSPAVDSNYGYAACYSTPDKGLPEDGILGQMPPQREGWLIQSLDLSLTEQVRNDGQVFNFKDMQRIEMQCEEAIRIEHRKL